MSTVWKSEDEDICIMERPTSKFYYMRVKRPDNGKWVQKSSKRTNFEAAKQEAFKWQAVMSDRIDRGVSATSVPFKVLCDRYIKEIDAEIAQYEATDGQEGRNLKDLRDHKTIVHRYILPYIGETDIESVGRIAVQDLIEKRRVYWVSGYGKDVSEIEYERGGKTVKRPARHELASASALLKFGGVLQRHFEIAVELNLLDETAVPPIKIKKASKAQKRRKQKIQPRAKFEVDQFKALLDYMPGWCLRTSQNKQLKRWSMHRLLLCDIVRFIADTGIRPGTETDNIRWKHIKAFDDKRGLDFSDPYTRRVFANGKRRIRIEIPKGKVGSRPAVGGSETVNAVMSIWQRHNDFHGGITDRDDYVEGFLYGRDEMGLEPLADFPETNPPEDMHLFALPDGTPFKESSWRKTFDRLMRDFARDTEEGATHDALGRKITPYSLRHGWINWQLEAGQMTIHQIAKQVGSETKVIEENYDKLDVESIAHKHVPVRDMD